MKIGNKYVKFCDEGPVLAVAGFRRPKGLLPTERVSAALVRTSAYSLAHRQHTAHLLAHASCVLQPSLTHNTTGYYTMSALH